MDLKSETFSSLSTNEVINRAVERKFYYETFLIDSKDRMWIAKSDGGVVRIDLNNNKIKEYNAVMEVNLELLIFWRIVRGNFFSGL